jgi:hypothetical protein
VGRVNRRDVIKMGAASGTALAGLGLRGAGQASAAATNGVHIHGTLLVISDTPGGPFVSTTATAQQPGPEIHFIVSIDAWGPDADVSGQGWGASADPADMTQPARVDPIQRIYSQRGSIRGDVVTLKGRMLFSNVPGDEGGPITTEANLTTGHIRFIAGNSLSHAVLEGTGVVMRM